MSGGCLGRLTQTTNRTLETQPPPPNSYQVRQPTTCQSHFHTFVVAVWGNLGSQSLTTNLDPRPHCWGELLWRWYLLKQSPSWSWHYIAFDGAEIRIRCQKSRTESSLQESLTPVCFRFVAAILKFFSPLRFFLYLERKQGFCTGFRWFLLFLLPRCTMWLFWWYFIHDFFCLANDFVFCVGWWAWGVLLSSWHLPGCFPGSAISFSIIIMVGDCMVSHETSAIRSRISIWVSKFGRCTLGKASQFVPFPR